MKYKFPHITHIDDVLPHVEGRKEFVVAERDGFTVINYVVMTPDTFADDEDGWEYRRECRGITFCNETGRVVARKFHKFFNVNERLETEFCKLDLSQPHVILEKMDGSMITPFVRKEPGKVDAIYMHTKMGFTDIAKQAQAYINSYAANDIMYGAFCYDLDQRGFTPIFEWCSRQNRIVIDYAEDQLFLLAVRDNVTGEYWDYKRMVREADFFNIPVVRVHDATFDQDFLEYVRGLVGLEGFVVRFDNGHMVKIKAEDYLQLHKAKEGIAQEKNVWSMIINESADDLKSFLSDEDRKRVEAFEKDLWNEIGVMEDNLVIKFNSARCEVGLGDEREQKKDFAMAVMEYHPSIKSLLFAMYDGKDCRELVINFIQNNLGTGTKLDKIRPLFNNIRFEEVEYEE